MSCTATPDTGELSFVLALHTRTKAGAECRGPLVTLSLLDRVFIFDQIFDSPTASALLWSGYDQDASLGFRFGLCAAHWLDLACLIWMRSQQQDRVEFYLEADQLLREVCQQAGWDAKEIVNLFQWQRARLT